MIPDQNIEEVKQRANIVDVVGRYVTLKKRGRNHVGLCPFHGEKTPSFNVRADGDGGGYYKCFGCGVSGDVIKFLMEKTGLSFADAVRQLAEEYGVDIVEERQNPETARRKSRDAKLYRVLERVQMAFANQLRAKNGAHAMAYVKNERELSDDTLRMFGFGYGGETIDVVEKAIAGDDLDKVLLLGAGVVTENDRGAYPLFRRRLTLPIRDVRGRIVGFGGRQLDKDKRRPKYVNSPGGPLYDKSKVLYGLDMALPALKRKKPVVLVEGYFDVIACHLAGVPTAVAPCGTSLTPAHVELLGKYTDTVVLCMDADSAGQKAADKALLMLLKAGMTVKRCLLTDKDPDEMVRAGQGETLRRRLETAADALSEKLDEGRAATSPAERIQLLDQLLPYLDAPPRAAVKEAYLNHAADVLGSTPDVLREELAAVAQKAERKKARSRPRRGQPERGERRGGRGPCGPAAAPAQAARGPQGGAALQPWQPPPPPVPDVPRGWDGQPLPQSAAEQDGQKGNWKGKKDDWKGKRGDRKGKKGEWKSKKDPAADLGVWDGGTGALTPRQPRSEADLVQQAVGGAGRAVATAWSSADIMLGRMLIAHPQLVPLCGVLEPFVGNPSLRLFIHELAETMVRHHDLAPHHAFSKTRIPPDPALVQLIKDHMNGLVRMEETDARAHIDSMAQRIDDAAVRKHVLSEMRAMRAAESEGDMQRALAILGRVHDATIERMPETERPALPAPDAPKAAPRNDENFMDGWMASMAEKGAIAPDRRGGDGEPDGTDAPQPADAPSAPDIGPAHGGADVRDGPEVLDTAAPAAPGGAPDVLDAPPAAPLDSVAAAFDEGAYAELDDSMDDAGFEDDPAFDDFGF